MLLLSFMTHFAVGINLLAQVPLVNSVALHGRAAATLDDFIASESPIALQGIFNNIGSAGSNAVGVALGLVVASPTKENPDYFDTWTRDSALTFKALVDAFIAGNTSLRSLIEDYIYAQAQLQALPNPSGNLSDGQGLGEPKFEVDGTAFTAPWGRPQRDGPALRATAIIAYSRWLISNGEISFVTAVTWPIITNDLSFIGQYWNWTTYDLWEETLGSSFFTTAVQHRALVEGNALAGQIGKTCVACGQAPQVLCFLGSYWDGDHIAGNQNEDNQRSRKDLNTILGIIHTFDPSAAHCDDTTFQPCSDIALANHKVVSDSFRTVYSINAGIPEGSGVGIGRYPEDTYQGGNPWYLGTMAAAEQLYDALYQWNKIGSLEVSSTSLAFFRDFSPTVATGTYSIDTPTYTTLSSGIKAYADSYMALVQKYTPADGSLAEQFSRNDGTPLSAKDLTWSYAAFLTAVAARDGVVPASWNEPSGNTPPSACAGSTATGTYVAPTATAPLPPCTAQTTVAVTFNVADTTTSGENVFISGNITALGNWNTANAVALSAVDYQAEYPRWYVTIKLATGTAFAYKYVNQGVDGSFTYEGGANREYVVEGTCATEVQVHDRFQT